jgi:hypothetical protein
MFERFSQAARGVVVDAMDVAIELGSETIVPGHLLYGCAEVRDETAGEPLRDLGITGASVRAVLPRVTDPPAGVVDPDALSAIGIDYDAVRTAVEGTFGPGALGAAPDRRQRRDRGRPPFTHEAKRTLQLALRAALELHHRRMLPGHVLLGVIRVDDALVLDVLDRAGVSVATLSAAVMAGLAEAA